MFNWDLFDKAILLGCWLFYSQDSVKNKLAYSKQGFFILCYNKKMCDILDLTNKKKKIKQNYNDWNISTTFKCVSILKYYNVKS